MFTPHLLWGEVYPLHFLVQEYQILTVSFNKTQEEIYYMNKYMERGDLVQE